MQIYISDLKATTQVFSDCVFLCYRRESVYYLDLAIMALWRGSPGGTLVPT